MAPSPRTHARDFIDQNLGETSWGNAHAIGTNAEGGGTYITWPMQNTDPMWGGQLLQHRVCEPNALTEDSFPTG